MTFKMDVELYDTQATFRIPVKTTAETKAGKYQAAVDDMARPNYYGKSLITLWIDPTWSLETWVADQLAPPTAELTALAGFTATTR